MKHQKKFAQEQQQASEVQSQQKVEHEFATVEELLRFDAAQTAVPPEIVQRLQKSAAEIHPSAPRSWWQRWLNQQ